MSDFIQTIPTIRQASNFKTKINFEGFNMSFIVHPENPNMYLATIRQAEKFEDQYPEYYNRTFLLELSHDFQVMTSEKLTEESRETYRSYSIGVEDCRLISDKFMTSVALDTNPDWIPEMCFCEISREEGMIKNVKPLKFDTTEKKPEKNWIVFKHLEKQNVIHMLHSYDPIKVISINTKEGHSQLISMKRIFKLTNCEVHGGSCVYLPHLKQYLVIVRVIQDHKYIFSHWILFNELYTYLGISPAFRFEPTKKVENYEMCMGLIYREEDNCLLCSVSINDKSVYIYGFNINMILDEISDE
jgi:ribosomal protein S8